MSERIAYRRLAEKRLNDLIEMQAIIEQQSAEIAALRGSGLDCYKPTYRQAFKHSELYSNQTKLLADDCECPFTMGDDYIEVAHEPIGICVSCGETAYTRNPEKPENVLCWACAYDSAN